MPSMTFQVRQLDSGSLARSGTLTVGSRSMPTPFRWTGGPWGPEDRAIAFAAPTQSNPFRSARMLTRQVIHATMKNIQDSNGKSQQLRSQVESSLGSRGEETVVRAVHLRWNRSSVWRDVRYNHRTVSSDAAKSFFEFCLPLGVDFQIPAVPPGIDRFEVFTGMIDAYVASLETWNQDIPLMGYIPNMESLSLARRMVEYYDKKGCSFYGIDLAGGHPSQLITAVVRYLRENRTHDYFLHAFNVRQTRPSMDAVVPVEDYLHFLYGFDSFSPVTFGGGANDPDNPPSVEDIKDRSRFVDFSSYGAYRRSALRAAKMQPGCNCSVCRVAGSPLDLYRGSAGAAQARVRAHAILAGGKEVERLRKTLESAGLHGDLAKRPGAEPKLRQIDSDVARIRAPSLG